MGDQLRGFDAGAWLYDHGGGDSLDPVGMGDAEDCHLGDRRVGEDGLLDLPAGDVLAAGLDHVLLPVHHRQVSIGVDHAKIPGVEPAVFESLSRPLRVLPVASHRVRAAVHDLPDLAGRNGLVRVIDHHRLHVQPRPTGGAEPGELLVGLEDGGDGRHLGLSVEIPEPQLGKARRDLLEHLDGHRRCAVVALLQRG